MEALTRIKALNPDVIYISSTPEPAAVIIKNAKDLGMYPGVTIGVCHAAMTKALVDLARSGRCRRRLRRVPHRELGR